MEWYERNKVLQDFFKVMQKRNLELLDEDKKWIRKVTKNLPAEELRNMLISYAKKWQEGIKSEPCDVKKQNSGRRKANLYLLDLINE